MHRHECWPDWGEPVIDSDIDRRRLAKGVAWSLPVIVAASAAPAVAASPTPTLSVYGRATYNLSWYPEYVDGSRTFKLFTTTQGSSRPGPSFCIQDTRASSDIANAKITYHLPYYDLRFSSAGPGSNGWSVLSRDYSVGNRYYNGATYYAYTTEYRGTITPRDGATCLPSYGFESNGPLNPYKYYFFVDHSVEVNGQTPHVSAGPVEMVS